MIMKIKSFENFNIEVIEANLFLKIRGLMFRRKNKAKPILFKFNKPASLHSLFVFFNFLAIWLDDKNRIVDIKLVKPFSFHVNSKKNYTQILEIPLSDNYSFINKEIFNRFKSGKLSSEKDLKTKEY